MSFRQHAGKSNRAMIRRDVVVGENDAGEPIYSDEPEVIAKDVPCRFNAESTSFVRETSGEHVLRPATATFDTPVADTLREGDLVSIEHGDADVDGDDESGLEFEIVGLEPTTDHRRGVIVSVTAELAEVE